MACNVNVTGGTLPQAEIDAYIARATKKFGREPFGMDIHVDGDYVDLSYDFGTQPFQRIRRITGYLVGTLDRFNNAKRAEEHDRVKHGLPESN
ncbi:MAG: anaerobic ribonucleoside-triphosphate reductase [Aristaeellaceae bacterium]